MADKPTKNKFKQTKQLVRMALNDGWTQADIAKLCRTQQSIVSAWKRGEDFATIQQLTPLLKLYGTKLRRNSSRLYCCINEEKEYCYYRVEGKIIFSSICYSIIGIIHKPKKTANIKFVVHYQGNGVFRFIYQQKREILPLHKNQTKAPTVFTFDDDDAGWLSKISNPISISELLNHVHEITISLEETHANEAATLSFFNT